MTEATSLLGILVNLERAFIIFQWLESVLDSQSVRFFSHAP